VFTPRVIDALNGIGTWAVALFVCLAGLELDLRMAWRERRDTAVTAGLALGVPLLCGGLAALVLLRTGGLIGDAAAPWQFVVGVGVGVGMACAVTALPILIAFMDKLAILRQPLGERVLRYASVDDIVIWGVLAAVLLDWQRVGLQFAFLLVFAACTAAFRRLMARLDAGDRWPALLAWLALCALGAEWAGLHFMVGAFLAGAVADAGWFDREHLDRLRHHVLLILMPVYFLGTGLRTHWETGGASVFAAAALLLAAAVGGKLAGVRLAGRILGWPPGEATTIGWLLQTKALITIVFANVLLDRGIISADAFTALLLMALASTVLTIPMVSGRLAGDSARG
jgi:Kef-type K+ transport system membrane component KefB